jgi:hypothetical protein
VLVEKSRVHRHAHLLGGGDALKALLSNTVQLSSGVLAPAHPQIKAGRHQGLAVAGEKRWHDLPDIPTMIESGYDDFVFRHLHGADGSRQDAAGSGCLPRKGGDYRAAQFEFQALNARWAMTCRSVDEQVLHIDPEQPRHAPPRQMSPYRHNWGRGVQNLTPSAADLRASLMKRRRRSVTS